MANQKVNKRILIIEDEEILSKMYTLKFTNQGFDVLHAGDGATGLELAKKELPDIIILDVIMTQLDGFAVLGELKKDDKAKKIPVIMLSNLGQDEDIKKGKELGAVDYLVKANMTPMQVVNKVKEVLKI